jgi:hypothetical protein
MKLNQNKAVQERDHIPRSSTCTARADRPSLPLSVALQLPCLSSSSRATRHATPAAPQRHARALRPGSLAGARATPSCRHRAAGASRARRSPRRASGPPPPAAASTADMASPSTQTLRQPLASHGRARRRAAALRVAQHEPALVGAVHAADARALAGTRASTTRPSKLSYRRPTSDPASATCSPTTAPAKMVFVRFTGQCYRAPPSARL